MPSESSPEITIVVPAYGRATELDRCLTHLAKQEGEAGSYEVVVVDDGSPEDLSATALRHADIPVRFVRHEANRGRAAARNSGARAARGRFLLFLDSDMMATPRLVSAHRRTHRRAAESRTAVLGPIPVEPAFRGVLGRYMEGRGHMRPRLDRGRVPFRYFVSANSSLSRELFESVGGYDEAFTHYGGEDIDLGYRLHRAGVRMVLAPDAVAFHAFSYRVEAMAERMHEFGSLTLPLVFERHPELKRVFHLDLLEGRGPLVAGVFHLLTTPNLLRAARAIAPALGRVAPWIMSYVLVGHYFRGYAEHLARRE